MFQEIFQKIEPMLIRLYYRLSNPSFPNLRGDRDIEYSWILTNLPYGPGKALDFGSGKSYVGLAMARRGFDTIAIDLMPVEWFYIHPRLNFIQENIFELDLPPDSLDLIINCSSIEHVGLAGRYNAEKNLPDGDFEAMKKMRALLKPKGVMLLTIPVGKDVFFPPLHRVYGQERLPKLLESFKIEKEEYWIKNKLNQWVLTDKIIALNQVPNKNLYGLGCFILRPVKNKVTINLKFRLKDERTLIK